MAVYQADAIVIRSREYGEGDRILTLFARELGKLEAIAKGVKKPTSKQRGGTQLFTYADFLLYSGRSLDTVNQAQPRESFPHLWGEPELSGAAAAMAELLDAATSKGQPEPELFRLTLVFFFLLATGEAQLLQAAYGLRLLNAQGYLPDLAAPGREFADLSPGALAMLKRLLVTKPEQLDRLRWSEAMRREIIGALGDFAERRLEKKLKAWGVCYEIFPPTH